jgi:protein gp37
MQKTKIEWADCVVNPVVGCTKISIGCKNCYAEKMAHRLAHNPLITGYEDVVDADGRWTGKVTFREGQLLLPAKLRKPCRIFVCSMGDLFHENVHPNWIMKVLVMAEKNPKHTFLILTKRPDRALTQFGNWGLLPEVNGMTGSGERLPGNIWFGVTAETQEEYNRRVPILMQIPASTRFVSIEPMLGKVRVKAFCQHCQGFLIDSLGPTCGTCHRETVLPDWIICGAETGPRKRTMQTTWATDLEHQCKKAGIPFFFKKFSDGLPGGMPREFPE